MIVAPAGLRADVERLLRRLADLVTVIADSERAPVPDRLIAASYYRPATPADLAVIQYTELSKNQVGSLSF